MAGHGMGFSCFLGMSEVNTIWVATLDSDNQIVYPKLITFGKGDCVILPYGTLHAGDRNRSQGPCNKVFSEVFTKKMSDPESQLWVLEGRGYTKQKQNCQLNLLYPDPLPKKRKRSFFFLAEDPNREDLIERCRVSRSL